MIEPKPWRDSEPHPDEIDIDPSFPDEPVAQHVINEDLLGTKHRNARLWVKNGPIPAFRRYFLSRWFGAEKGLWILAHAVRFRRGNEVRRTGFARIRAFFLRSADLVKLRRILRSKNVMFATVRDTQSVSGFFAGEMCWRDDIPYASAESIRRVVGKRAEWCCSRLTEEKGGTPDSDIYNQAWRKNNSHGTTLAAVARPTNLRIRRRCTSCARQRLFSKACAGTCKGFDADSTASWVFRPLAISSLVEYDRFVRSFGLNSHGDPWNWKFGIHLVFARGQPAKIYGRYPVAPAVGSVGRATKTQRFGNERSVSTVRPSISLGTQRHQKDLREK